MENPADSNTQTPAATASDSLRELIEQAQRAHDLVEAVDLQRVAAHDAGELDKLANVTEALGDLAAGREVDHVEGVDEVIPQDPQLKRKLALLELLNGAGYDARVGRVLYMKDGKPTLVPHDILPHGEGLPEHLISVAPPAAVGNGHFGLFVSNNGCFAASLSDPASKHHWRIVRSGPFNSTDELLATLGRFDQGVFG